MQSPISRYCRRDCVSNRSLVHDSHAYAVWYILQGVTVPYVHAPLHYLLCPEKRGYVESATFCNFFSKMRAKMPDHVYSISFVWPANKTWNGSTGDRHPPRWYFECLVDFITRNSTKGVRFIVHLHEAIRDRLPTALLFDACRAPATLSLQYCDVELPPMWPNVQRFEPLIDCDTGEIVIVADIHDTPDLQTNTIALYLNYILDSSFGMILTFWPTSDEEYLAQSFRLDPSVAPPPVLEAVHHKFKNKWIVDGGLAMSTCTARSAIRVSHGVSFAQHISACSRHYNWDPEERNGTDEALLQLYLLTFRPMDIPVQDYERRHAMEQVVRRVARPFVHNLSRRSSHPARKEVLQPINFSPLYHYTHSSQRKQIAYDAEGRFAHRDQCIALEWKADRPAGQRVSKRRRQG